jgi:hypothetical protein
MTSNDAAACIFLGRTKSVVVRRFLCNGATGDRNANGLDSMANVLEPLAIKKNYDVQLEDSSFSNIRATGARGNEALGVELNGEKFVFDRVVVTDVLNDSTTVQGNRAIGFQIVSNRREQGSLARLQLHREECDAPRRRQGQPRGRRVNRGGAADRGARLHGDQRRQRDREHRIDQGLRLPRRPRREQGDVRGQLE